MTLSTRKYIEACPAPVAQPPGGVDSKYQPMPRLPSGALQSSAAMLLAALAFSFQPLSLLAQPPLPSRLRIVIVEGDGAIRETGKRVARPPVVRVEDENQRPIPGVAVQFQVPTRGPGGVFPGGGGSLQVRTDPQGRAEAAGLRANIYPGRYQIEVLAAYEGLTASAAIQQVNVSSGGGSSTKWIAIAVAAGGAAAAGIVLGSRKSASSAPASGPGTTISPGSPSVGGPQ